MTEASHYLAPQPRAEDAPDLAQDWKLQRDPYFRAVYKHYGSWAVLEAAGYFDDGVSPEGIGGGSAETDLLTTPVHKVTAALEDLDEDDDRPLCVLLTTGGFGPVHVGHMAMMETSKRAMEEKGYAVLGGYFSPSHDDYVSTKDAEQTVNDAPTRIRLLETAVADSDWLMVDPWEARYTGTAINFTDIVLRLKNYLAEHVESPRQIDVAYVFGSDNAGFARAFVDDGLAVCVTRPDRSEQLAELQADPLLDPERIVFADSEASHNISSSQVRRGHSHFLPESIRDLYYELNRSRPAQTDGSVYALRDEGVWSLEHLAQRVPAAELKNQQAKFVAGLSAALQDAIDPEAGLPVVRIPLEEQQSIVVRLEQQGPVLNLDACSSTEHNLHFSRLFDLSNGQVFPDDLIPRPGYESQKLDDLPEGHYTLVDDDIATGATIRMIQKLLPQTVTVERTVSLLDEYAAAHDIDPADIKDVVDVRDFLVGSRDSGLVVRLFDESVGRAPYMLPYVSLATRAKIPAAQEYELSTRLWQLNADFYGGFSQTVRLQDVDQASQKLFSYLGFGPETPMQEICQWHIDKLSRLAFTR